MIKRIIFDVDATLINWDNKHWNTVNTALVSLGRDELSNEKLAEFKKYSDNYLDSSPNFKITKLNFLKYINKNTGLKLDLRFFNRWLYYLGIREDFIPPEINETVEYLSKKYELYVLTNWFTASQKEILKRAGLLKYFKKVYGVDGVKPKPNVMSFKRVLRGVKPRECVFIGNSEKNDIIPAVEIGMKAILFNWESKEVTTKDVKVIKRFGELKEIL